MAEGQTPFVGGRIAGIDPLRGAAALAVVVCHIGGHFWNFTWLSPGPEKLFGWLGYWGVALFFVISGFCIRLPMARAKLADPQARLDPGEFSLHRVLRIVPPYWAALAASIGAGLVMRTELLDGAHGPLDVGLHILGLHTLWPSTLASINGVFWTIGVEIHFYVAYLMLANRRFGPGILATSLAAGLAVFAAVSLGLAGGWRQVGQTLFITSFWQWCLGAMLAEWHARRRPEAEPWRLWTVRIALIAISLGLGLADPRVAGLHAAPWLLPFAAAGVVASFVTRQIGGTPSEGGVGRVFSWLGRVSYSLYLFHPVVLSLAAFAIAQGWLATGAGPAAELVGSLLVAWIAYQAIERPSLRWRARHRSTVNRPNRTTKPA